MGGGWAGQSHVSFQRRCSLWGANRKDKSEDLEEGIWQECWGWRECWVMQGGWRAHMGWISSPRTVQSHLEGDITTAFERYISLSILGMRWVLSAGNTSLHECQWSGNIYLLLIFSMVKKIHSVHGAGKRRHLYSSFFQNNFQWLKGLNI